MASPAAFAFASVSKTATPIPVFPSTLRTQIPLRKPGCDLTRGTTSPSSIFWANSGSVPSWNATWATNAYDISPPGSNEADVDQASRREPEDCKQQASRPRTRSPKRSETTASHRGDGEQQCTNRARQSPRRAQYAITSEG